LIAQALFCHQPCTCEQRGHRITEAGQSIATPQLHGVECQHFFEKYSIVYTAATCAVPAVLQQCDVHCPSAAAANMSASTSFHLNSYLSNRDWGNLPAVALQVRGLAETSVTAVSIALLPCLSCI
jgi:hypothetical protein